MATLSFSLHVGLGGCDSVNPIPFPGFFFVTLGWSTREKNVAPYVSEMELWACRVGDWIGLGYMLSGSVSRWGTECRAGRR